jgi:hypothetical protein
MLPTDFLPSADDATSGLFPLPIDPTTLTALEKSGFIARFYFGNSSNPVSDHALHVGANCAFTDRRLACLSSLSYIFGTCSIQNFLSGGFPGGYSWLVGCGRYEMWVENCAGVTNLASVPNCGKWYEKWVGPVPSTAGVQSQPAATPSTMAASSSASMAVITLTSVVTLSTSAITPNPTVTLSPSAVQKAATKPSTVGGHGRTTR